MNQIKFSHIYPKLWGQKKAELLAVILIDAAEVQKNKDLIEYDTRYEYDFVYDHHGTIQDYRENYYPLPKTGNLIQLIFIGDKQIPFCTIRRHTPEKEMFYRNLIGEWFAINIGDDL